MRKNIVVAGTGHQAHAAHVRKYCRNGLQVLLKREPGNQHDSNAIAVLLERSPFLGLFARLPVEIGYIKASEAKRLAPRMDDGVEISARVASFYAPPGRDWPRVSIEISDEGSL